MKSIRRFLPLALAMLLATGCNSNGGDSDSNASPPPPPSQAATMADDAPTDQPIAGPVVIPTANADVAAGKALFATNCAGCHGATGKGDGSAGADLDPKPRNFHTAPLQFGSDDAHLYTTVWLGAKHWSKAAKTSGMAGFKGRLKSDQVLQILAYVKHDLLGKK
ncbi:MAG TPA: cytochrome c [Candidatus Xenobia bacterium]